MLTLPHTTTNSYRTSLDRVRSFIREHYAEEMNIADLARLAGFSKSHFQRMFHATLGETLCEHIKRIRLEKSAGKLMTAGDRSVTDVAHACGFSSSQSFARAFKAHYGIAPHRLHPGVGKTSFLREKWQNMQTSYGRKYLLPKDVRPDGTFIQIPFWTSEGKEFLLDLEVVDRPPLRVAYVRTVACIGSPEIGEAMNHLVDWAIPLGLFTGNYQFLRAIQAFPDEEGRYTFDSAISVPENIDAEEGSGVTIQNLPAGEYVVYSAKFSSVDEILETWKKLVLGWWISSYSLRDHLPHYELYYNNPDLYPTWTLIADLCLPITTRRTK